MIEPITNQNDIYLYFEAIRQMKAKSVLDIGMTLKRCGAVCRQVADSAIEPAVHLCGIDLDPETTPPVYHSIYQEILAQESLFKKTTGHYDLAVLLNLPKDVLSDQALLKYTRDHAAYLLSDREAEHCLLQYFSREGMQTITLDHDQYLLTNKTQGEKQS